MKIAIPVTEGVLDAHFGHCKQFALIEVDSENQTILNTTEVAAPPHEPGLLPRWLKEQSVNLVITGGMGQRAVQLCNDNQIEVILGAPSEAPESIVKRHLQNQLETQGNACDH